jgi:hypothetical protein
VRQYLSVKLKTLNQVGWVDVLVTQHLQTFVGLRCRLTQPTKTLNRAVLGREITKMCEQK